MLSGAQRQDVRMNKPLNWFEIPTLDFARARAFYEQILDVALRVESIGDSRLAIFPYQQGSATGGCLLQAPGYQPSRDGVAIYLNTCGALDAVLRRVVAEGGQILVPRTELPPGMGAFAHVIDSEGNRVGLHEEG